MCYYNKAVTDCCTQYGGIAQLGERLNGIQEVSGSIPLISTKCGRGGTGRRARLRGVWATVRVQVSSAAPENKDTPNGVSLFFSNRRLGISSPTGVYNHAKGVYHPPQVPLPYALMIYNVLHTITLKSVFFKKDIDFLLFMGYNQHMKSRWLYETVSCQAWTERG